MTLDYFCSPLAAVERLPKHVLGPRAPQLSPGQGVQDDADRRPATTITVSAARIPWSLSRELPAPTRDGMELDESVLERSGIGRRDLLTERKGLPVEIAALSAEGKRLVDTIAEVPSAARQLIEARLTEVGEQLERLHARLSAVEQEIANLDVVEVDAGWVGRCLADFDAVWDVLTPENRLRLVRAVVQRVEVNEPENEVKVVITDFASAEAETPYEVAV